MPGKFDCQQSDDSASVTTSSIKKTMKTRGGKTAGSWEEEMAIAAGIAIATLPSALAVAWFVWHSGVLEPKNGHRARHRHPFAGRKHLR
jgi:hypothetical protein